VKHVPYVDSDVAPGAVDNSRECRVINTSYNGRKGAGSHGVSIRNISTDPHSLEADEPDLLRRDDLQLPSARKLLDEYGEDVDVFSPRNVPEGVDILFEEIHCLRS
jgi:hypothetical protein